MKFINPIRNGSGLVAILMLAGCGEPVCVGPFGGCNQGVTTSGPATGGVLAVTLSNLSSSLSSSNPSVTITPSGGSGSYTYTLDAGPGSVTVSGGSAIYNPGSNADIDDIAKITVKDSSNTTKKFAIRIIQ